MPKVVDHAERREEILDATRRVILKQGLGGVTMRSIATEVGKSTGHVNHYFEDKGGLLVAALESSMERFDRRLREQSSGKAPGRATLHALLLAALPENDEERVHWILWFGAGRHVPWGSQDDAVRAIQRAPYEDWHRLIRENFEIAVEAGEFRPKLDARSEVDRLVAIIVGLGVESAFLGVTKKRSKLLRLIDDQLATLDT
ncbi:MAG: TetR/AcrR family transcriptional regulator [Myxococcota bacterium]